MLFSIECTAICLSRRHYHHIVDTYVLGQRYGEIYALGYIASRKRLYAFVCTCRTLCIAFETYYRKLSLYRTGADVGYLYVVPQHIDTHRFAQSVYGVLGGTVHVAVLVDLFTCYGADIYINVLLIINETERTLK